MAAADLLKKSHVQVREPTSMIERKPSKSCSNFFCQSFIVILVLVVIPLFPPQAPEFINKSILTEFWELLHLLFIGLAVCYGLFSRKCVKMEIENQSSNDSSHAYLSGILNVSSFFEDGIENVCISEEKKITENWISEYLHSESKFEENSANDEGKKRRSFTLRNESDDLHEADRENESQIWNSQYFQGESLVVVADGNYTLDEHKPLGLPIRSLRSRIADTVRPEVPNKNETPSSLKNSFDNNSKKKVEKIRGMTPSNLEKKFEKVVGPSTIPWKSRSGRMEIREEGRTPEPPCHYRPHSIGELEFENFHSRSVQHPVYYGTSSKPSASKINTTLSSFSPELSNLKAEISKMQKDLQSPYDSTSNSKVAEGNGGASIATSKARGFSIGSSSELDIQRSLTNDLKDQNKSEVQDLLGRQSNNSVNSEVKRSNLAKILSRAKSVRTIRPGYLSDKMERKDKYPGLVDDEVEPMCDQFEAPILVNTVKQEPKDQVVNDRKQNHGKVYPMPQSAGSEYHNGEKLDLPDSALVSEEDSVSDSKSDHFQESSDEKEAEKEADPNEVDDAELEGSEVDRKADEFIAKFREQIRLQKIASFKRSSG